MIYARHPAEGQVTSSKDDWARWFARSSRINISVTLFTILEQLVMLVPVVAARHVTDSALAGQYQEFIFWGFVLLAAIATHVISTPFLSIFENNVKTRLAWGMRERLLARWLDEDIDHLHSGKIQELFASDVMTAVDGKSAQYMMVGYLMGAIPCYWYFIHLNVPAGMLAMVLGLCGALTTWLSGPAVKRAHTRTREESLATGQQLTDVINVAPLIKVAGVVQHWMNVCMNACEKRREAEVSQRRLQAAIDTLRYYLFLGHGVVIGVYGILGLQVIYGHATPGAIAAFVSGLSWANQFPQLMLSTWERWQRGDASLKLLMRIIPPRPSEDRAADRGEPVGGSDRPEPCVDCQGVEFAYPESGHGIRGISLHVKAGEVVHLFGRNGSGKSTLLKVIAGLLYPSGGSVRVNGVDVRRSGVRTVRREISWASEEATLFRGSLEENLRLGRPEAGPAELQEACVLAGLDQVIESLPQGLSTMVEEEGSNLSGGQRQLVSLARAILRDGSVVLFDDAFSEIDVARRARLYESLRGWLQGKAALIASPTPEDGALATRTVMLANGRIVEDSEQGTRSGEGESMANA